MPDAKPAAAMPLPDAVAGNFQEAVRWFGQMWGGAGEAAARGSGPIPSMLMPTLDVKELDKRIADLRSVEHWLKLNLGLLQTTIQGLEMQRGTLSAWQSFGAAASAAANAGATGTPGSGTATGTPEAPPFQPALWWTSLQQQFAQMAAAAAGDPAAAGSASPGAAAAGNPADTATGKAGTPKAAAAKPRGGG